VVGREIPLIIWLEEWQRVSPLLALLQTGLLKDIFYRTYWQVFLGVWHCYTTFFCWVLVLRMAPGLCNFIPTILFE
jgi:hypothetical protein